ncbi:MAG: universal stress protein, partial [Chloroflexi bacterium]|nr:universal stress protein [Chloroflexota bacterium]
MKVRKLLVPISGQEADNEAVRMACRLAKPDKGKVFVLFVVEVKRSLPLDVSMEPEVKRGEGVLAQVERIAEEEDYEVVTSLLQSREVGPAIVDEAAEIAADLIIMGVEYKRRVVAPFTLSDTALHVLKNATCKVLLLREP